MSKLMIKRIAAVAMCALLLCGCAKKQEESGTVSSAAPQVEFPATAFDVTVEACPQTVVSLVPEVTDIIVALGSDAQLAAISDNCVDIRSLPRVGTAFLPDTAKIKEMGTDLVFTSSVTSASDLEILRNAGILVAVVTSPARYAELPAMYSQVATLMSGHITGVRNASNTFTNIDDKIKRFSNSSSNSVTASILVADGVAISDGNVASDLAGFAGITLTDAEAAEVIVFPQSIFESTKAKHEGKRVVEFDVTMLDRRGANMYDAITSLASALEVK